MTPAEKFARSSGQTERVGDDIVRALAGEHAAPAVPRPASHRTGPAVPGVSARLLTGRQKTVLAQLARAAYAIQHRLGLAGDSFDDWRREQSISAVGCRISEARQAHYLALRAHYEALAGKNTADTFAAAVAPGDDPDRQAVAQHIRSELAAFAQIPDDDGRPTGEHRAEAYCLAIARARSVSSPATISSLVQTWPVARLWTLVYTLRNRRNAKLGVGQTARRNKSQRRA